MSKASSEPKIPQSDDFNQMSSRKRTRLDEQSIQSAAKRAKNVCFHK